MARQQVTGFLPELIRRQVDEIRSRWDPIMARRISAHITIVYGARDSPGARSRLVSLRAHAPLLARLTSAQCWGTPEDGIYLGVDDVRHDIARARAVLQVVEAPGRTYAPHVTLLHPGTVHSHVLREAWAKLASWSVDALVEITDVALIERGEDGVWHVVA